MLSVPLYTVMSAPRVLVTDKPKLGTFQHIRNLSLSFRFYEVPQRFYFACYPSNLEGWVGTCETLASMTMLRYLCIRIRQERFFHRYPAEETSSLVRELIEPLERISVSPEGTFDVITEGWTVPYELKADLPFKVFPERGPTRQELAMRTSELGEFSRNAYVDLTDMSPAFSCRQYHYPAPI